MRIIVCFAFWVVNADALGKAHLAQQGGNTMREVVITDCVRTAVGKMNGALSEYDEQELAAVVIPEVLRRSKISSEHKLHIGDITLDYDSLSVSKDGEIQVLPQKEFYLLYTLLSFPKKVFTRIQLMDSIWGINSETVLTTVNVHVNRLRQRFKDWDEFSIVAIRGIGYMAVINNEK